MLTVAEIEKGLENFNGDLERWQIESPLIITPGVKFLGENAECFWLFTAIASYQSSLARKKGQAADMLRDFQVWKLRVNGDKTAVLTCVPDSEMPSVVTQYIEYTDFPLFNIDLWVGPDNGDGTRTLYLPSEH